MDIVPVVLLPMPNGKFYLRVEGGALSAEEVLALSMELAKKIAEYAENVKPAPVTRLVVPRG